MAAPKPLPSPSPERVSVFTFPTPLSDLLFWERVDIANQRVWDMQKGDPHWDRVKYPNHKLVHKQPLDSGGKWQQYYYAAPRANQDAYNWEFSQADIGGIKFDSVVRTYVTLRSAYTPSTPAQGASMPNVPTGMFGTGSGSPSVIAAYVLAGRKELKLGNELDGLFVAEQLEYVKRVSVADISTDRALGVGVKKTTTLYYRGEVLTGTTKIEDAAVDPNNAYWGLQSDGVVREVQELTANWWAVIEISSLDAARLADVSSMPSTVKLDLPYVLTGIGLSWNVAGSDGSFEAEASGRCATVGDPRIQLNPNESASAECGGSIQPEVTPVIRPPKTEPVPSTAYFFQIKKTGTGVTLAQVLSRLQSICGNPNPAIALWPSFGTVAHTLTLKGQRASGQAQVNANASISAKSSGSEAYNDKELTCGKGVSYDYATTTTTLEIRPTIHGAIHLNGVDGNGIPQPATMSQPYTAECTVEWASASSAGTIAGYSTICPVPAEPPFGANVLDPTANTVGELKATATITLAASVEPYTLPATTPSAIPSSGYYLDRNYRVEPADDDWFRVYAEVFNAADI